MLNQFIQDQQQAQTHLWAQKIQPQRALRHHLSLQSRIILENLLRVMLKNRDKCGLRETKILSTDKKSTYSYLKLMCIIKVLSYLNSSKIVSYVSILSHATGGVVSAAASPASLLLHYLSLFHITCNLCVSRENQSTHKPCVSFCVLSLVLPANSAAALFLAAAHCCSRYHK